MQSHSNNADIKIGSRIRADSIFMFFLVAYKEKSYKKVHEDTISGSL